MGSVKAICVSERRGTAKYEIEEAVFIEDFGIRGDAHAGKWHRQVSLLSYEKIEEFRQRGAAVETGAFGENLVIDGYDLRRLPIGSRLRVGAVLLEITQIGKECHSHCAIYQQVGDCIMPREGIFARVLKGGTVRKGDVVVVESKPEY